MREVWIGCKKCEIEGKISVEYSRFKNVPTSFKNFIFDERHLEDTPFFLEENKVYCKK